MALTKDAIRTAVNELEWAGYIERHQTTDEGGKFSSNGYIIKENIEYDHLLRYS